MFGRVWKGTTVARTAALDALGASVMLADESLTITYVNPAATALLREAEADLRREWPRFSVASMVGSNVGMFHRGSPRQLEMLKALPAPHRATINAGRRAFDLVFSPLFDCGRRTGVVVEWSDAAPRLLNRDHAAQVAAISRSQAIIEFTTDGVILDANHNFLETMGYALAEVVGRHHRMFVCPETARSPEYAALWETLRRGGFHAAQFRRLGKGGREVWIEATYNPIFDSDGTVLKVVKFATDISGQIKLLADLKSLIDRNFGEIDGAIGRSAREAGSASGAASHMSGNVQAAAAGAQQLASSIGELSQRMDRSRAATESAFEQTVAVGRSAETLTAASRAMSGIVGLISSVASQINLLALNATIEAARAGETGKGFAVVAAEVRSLAVTAAGATERIAAEIDCIQATSTDVAGALGAMRALVTTMRESVAQTATAVAEQAAVTGSVSDNMRSASGAVSAISASITEISSAVLQAAHAVATTKQAAQVLVR